MVLETKVCSKCGIEKPIEMFGKCESNKDKLQYMCKECTNKYAALYYKEHRNKRKKYRKEYHKKNKEKENLGTKINYKNNRIKRLEYFKQYREENKDHIS